MPDKLKRIRSWVVLHKKTSVVLALVVIFLGYKIYQNYTSTAGDPKYILTTIQKGSINTTVTGTGQVSADNQVDIQSKATGNITGVYVKPGQKVTAGTLLAQVDSTDASLSMQSAQVSYDKFVEPPKPEDIRADQNAVNVSYNEGWNAVSGTFIDYPSLITGMDNLLYSPSGYLSDQSSLKRNDTAHLYIQKAGVSYDAAKNQYTVVLAEYNSLSRSSATSSLDLLINDTKQMAQEMADALKNTQNAIIFISQAESNTAAATTAGTNVNSWLSTITGHLTSILSAQSSITNSQNALNTLMKGPDPLDVQAQKITLQKQQLAYQDYFIRAPFDSTIARVQASIGNPAGTVATIVSNSKIATISLNEVDVAKIKVGDKVNLTFDAIDGLNITGQVAEVDQVGTVSQGVVNYNVKISFDTQDDRVKSGMSVNASVITESRQDVLTVPSSAVKTQGNISYVNYFDQKYTDAQASAGITTATPPLSKQVEIGISDDTNTEIVSGINEGDQIVSKTVNQAAAASGAPSIFGAAAGGRTGGGNAIRRIGG